MYVFVFVNRFSRLMLCLLWCFNVSILLRRALSCTEQGRYRYDHMKRTVEMLAVFETDTTTDIMIHCRLGSSTFTRTNYCRGILLRVILLKQFFADVKLC